MDVLISKAEARGIYSTIQVKKPILRLAHRLAKNRKQTVARMIEDLLCAEMIRQEYRSGDETVKNN